MRLNELLAEKKSAIVKEWFQKSINTYPADTAKFLKRQKDPFANPVGRTLRNGLEDVFDHLLNGIETETASALLDPMIRIRAIQNFTPSQAVGFLFFLKSIIRNMLSEELKDTKLQTSLLGFEASIDRMGFIGFDTYMKCREKLWEIKSNEIRNTTYKAFKRAGLISEAPNDDPSLK